MTAAESSGTNQRFQNQVVMVIGAGSGIGRSTAQLCALEGARLVLVDLDEAKVRETQSMILDHGYKLNSIVLKMDVTSPLQWEEAMDRVIKECGRLDVMIQSAGITDDAPLVDLSPDQWRRVMSVNLDGAFLGTAAAIKAMSPHGEGTVVHVASLSGVKVFPGAAAYGVSKAALIHLTKTAAIECAQAGHRIRVNCVVPGGVKTPMWEKTPMWPSISESEEWKAGAEAPALKRFAEPEEIARAILFLASKDASYVNGEALMVDGGGCL